MENSILFIRLFTSLDAIVGDKESARIWLRGANIVFGDSPFNVIQSVEGAIRRRPSGVTIIIAF